MHSDDVLTDISQLTPAWLTGRLRAQGLLSTGEVVEIQVLGSRQSNVSQVYHLEVRYSASPKRAEASPRRAGASPERAEASAEPVDVALQHSRGASEPANAGPNGTEADAPESAPTRLFLKIPGPDFAWGSHEIEFYTRLVPEMHGASARGRARHDTAPRAALPFLRCYDAAYDPASARSHLLLEDLSATHYSTEGPLPPTRAHMEQMVDAYAALHAFWWEHPRLGQDIGERLTDERIDAFLEMARGKLAGFQAFMEERVSLDQGEGLAPSQEAILERVVSDWPAERRRRVVQGMGITIVHRDPHPLNVLYPRDLERDTVRLIDWQSWRVDTGTDDLAYWMACHWPPEARHTHEQDLLRRYHAKLLEGGVSGYTWANCHYDYRASIIRCLFFLLGAWSPVQWERGWWWDRLQLGMAAYQSLDCDALLPG